MGLVVQKFGGTSVGTPERLRKVAQRIAKSHTAGHQLVIVVSAMGHTTDELIQLANQVSSQPHRREMDMLLSTGERVSMALLSMALWDLNIAAVSLTGSQSGIITDESHRRARIRRILGNRIREGLAEGRVVIVAGFQGVSETKEITTLGRGGSDTTAVALAAALNADLCEIFTDVEGVYSADPRMVEQPKLWNQIPHDLMVELATRGAGVLHPRSVELAKQFSVPLWVRNSLSESEGTAVISRVGGAQGLGHAVSGSQKNGMEEFGVTGVTFDSAKFLIQVQVSSSQQIQALWARASESHLLILTPFFNGNHVQFFAERETQSEWSKNLQSMLAAGLLVGFKLDLETGPLSVIGDRFSQDGSALQQVLETLLKQNIPVQSGSASSLAMTVGIPCSRAQEGVRALHSTFLEVRA